MEKTDFMVAEVAKMVGCHRSTVLRYEQRGMIQSMRDNNNFRRYPLREALKLKQMLSLRTEESSGNV